MKKLYMVEMMVMVMAEDEDEAIDVATGWGIEITSYDCDVTKVVGVPQEWEDAIPFGADDDRTCKEVLRDEKYDLHSHSR